MNYDVVLQLKIKLKINNFRYDNIVSNLNRVFEQTLNLRMKSMALKKKGICNIMRYNIYVNCCVLLFSKLDIHLKQIRI